MLMLLMVLLGTLFLSMLFFSSLLTRWSKATLETTSLNILVAATMGLGSMAKGCDQQLSELAEIS
jgi:hypothetical protein